MEIEKRIYDGNRAKEILENEVFQAVFQQIKQEFTEQWQQSPARDSEGREKLWMMLKLAEKFEAMVKTTLETGKLAQLELQHKQSLVDRAKEWIG